VVSSFFISDLKYTGSSWFFGPPVCYRLHGDSDGSSAPYPHPLLVVQTAQRSETDIAPAKF
jgi:hypothetical protein